MVPDWPFPVIDTASDFMNPGDDVFLRLPKFGTLKMECLWMYPNIALNDFLKRAEEGGGRTPLGALERAVRKEHKARARETMAHRHLRALAALSNAPSGVRPTSLSWDGDEIEQYLGLAELSVLPLAGRQIGRAVENAHLAELIWLRDDKIRALQTLQETSGPNRFIKTKQIRQSLEAIEKRIADWEAGKISVDNRLWFLITRAARSVEVLKKNHHWDIPGIFTKRKIEK